MTKQFTAPPASRGCVVPGDYRVSSERMRVNVCRALLDARLDEGRGHRIAVRTDDRAWTYGEIARLSARFAGLLADSGVERGDRVLIALPDSADFVAALFGTLRLGAVAVMVTPEAPPELARSIVCRSGAAALLVRGACESLRAAAATTPRIAVLDTGDAACRARLDAMSGSLEACDTGERDPALWLFSGGTTGQPKIVVQSHGSFLFTTRQYGHGLLGLTADDITISVPKLYFGYATGSNLFFPFSVGASCVLFEERSSPERLFDLVARHRPTVLVNTPSMVQRMVAHPGASAAVVSSLRLATSAGEALPASLHELWDRTFGVELLDGLGTAEMWHIFLSNRPGQVVRGSLGRVVPGFEVRLCDEDGRDVPAGAFGTMRVRGGALAEGYWDDAEATCDAFQDGWYLSGDVLRRQADGTYVYCGRSDDLLKVSGRWFSPVEVEDRLLSHRSVTDVAVVGVPDAAGLARPVAFVVAEGPGPALEEELRAWARDGLEGYKCPRDFVFIERLPRTHLGKVDRGRLTREAGERSGTIGG